MGMEGSAVLVDHARARLDGQAEVLQHDLDTPLDPLDDATFDGVVCALVLHHLRNRPLFLREVFAFYDPVVGLLSRRRIRLSTGNTSAIPTSRLIGSS